MRNLSSAWRRALAFSLLAGVVALIVVAVVVPAFAYVQELRWERERATRMLTRLQSMVDAEPKLRELLSHLDSHPIWQKLYKNDDSHAAAVQMQSEFRAMAEAQGVTLDALQPLDPVAAGELTRLSLRVSFNTNIEKLSRLLLAVESGPKLLRLENLSITAPLTQNGQANPPLVVRAELMGYQVKALTP